MKLLFIGDIVGRPGRDAVCERVPEIIKEFSIDCCIANAENAAGGSGITPKVADHLLSSGVDLLTSGDHIWRNSEIFQLIDRTDKVIRPANFLTTVPGRGSTVIKLRSGVQIGVINLLGRVFMNPIENPFQAVMREIESIKKQTSVILVDVHAEATSEKIAMGWYLDGVVSAVVGTHTHVPTADNKVLPNGTAYITDVGMVGARYSVLGRDVHAVLKHFTTGLPARFTVAEGDIVLHSVIIDIDEHTGKARDIIRLER
ncbi:MAG: TIGR00282 family metallophosphoesterase [Candidatus Auribacterota bacterium]|jgi:metallophosphoesterase (TIGR00282 family)|nr:TIGR00282 family metallophosphoesterase [Candidatus Auribacterota bacterium]